jgi:16S rRNA (adenine1518-N6/adenine1519-N6)-dimethyltransferase
MATYPTLKVVKELLLTHGLAPRKWMGQNFLVEGNIARKSLDLAEILAGDIVVEIGPGLGALTQLLLAAGCQVYAIEKDNGLFRYLDSGLVPEFNKSLHLLKGDAMDNPLASLEPSAGEFKIVANLPYAISTPWLDEVLSGPLPSHMVLMLQKEAATRFVAESGSGNFGPIAIFLRSAYDWDTIHKVGAQCFYPRPEVGSALLSLKRKSNPLLFSREIKNDIRQIFRQRRKQISSLLAKLEVNPRFSIWLEKLVAEGLPRDTRPEAIQLEQWQRLAEH